jgi:hypothetical protein
MSSASFYKWRVKFGGMDTSMIKRMKELEDENRRLKKMYAEERLKAELRKEALEVALDFFLPAMIHLSRFSFATGYGKNACIVLVAPFRRKTR